MVDDYKAGIGIQAELVALGYGCLNLEAKIARASRIVLQAGSKLN